MVLLDMCDHMKCFGVDISNCLYDHANWTRSTYEVAFNTTPEPKQFIHYKLWDTLYYYGEDEKFHSTNENLYAGLEPIRISFSLKSLWFRSISELK